MAKAGMTVADMLNRRDRQGMVERLIAAETDPERVLCPMCGCAFLIPGTRAADYYGVCLTCLERAKRDANREYERLILARKENDAARQVAHRLKKRRASTSSERPALKTISTDKEIQVWASRRSRTASSRRSWVIWRPFAGPPSEPRRK